MHLFSVKNHWTLPFLLGIVFFHPRYGAVGHHHKDTQSAAHVLFFPGVHNGNHGLATGKSRGNMPKYGRGVRKSWDQVGELASNALLMRFEQLWIKQFTAVGSPLRGNPGILNQPRKKWNFKVTFLNKPWALVRKYFANMMTTAQFLEGSYLRRSNEIHGRNEQNRIKWGVFDCHEMVNMEEVQKNMFGYF